MQLFSPANIAKLQQLEVDLKATTGVDTVVGPYGAMEYAAEQLSVAPELIAAASARAEDPRLSESGSRPRPRDSVRRASKR